VSAHDPLHWQYGTTADMALVQRVGVVHAQDARRRRLTGRTPPSWTVCPPRPLLPTVHPAAALVSMHTTRMGA